MIPNETESRSSADWSARQAVLGFLTAPLRARSYANLLYLALAFPLGLAYFILLAVGFSLGLGLTIIWIGLPILALVFALSWGAASLERFMAIQMLGAEVPPMAPVPGQTPLGFWNRIGAFLSNPVTWKGISFLLLKFPLGMASFVATVALVAVTGAFLSAPFVYPWNDYALTFSIGTWEIDTLGESLICFVFGLVLALVSFNVLNGLGLVWKHLASFLLGSPRHAAPA
jgi:hypothetical protein